MRWKKNGFSYLIWFIYLLAAVLGLFCLGNVVCGFFEIPAWWGAAAGIFWLSLAGLTVYGLHVLAAEKNKTAPPGGREEKTGESRRAALVAEASLAVILLAAGLIFRIGSLDGAWQGTAYFEAASVIPGQEMPETAHGAMYLYLHLLHGIFYFLGNKMVLGVFCQIMLQLTALILLYLAVRRCAGKLGGMVFLGLCTFSDYLRGEALALSPGMLYLVIWAAVLLWTVTEDRKEIYLSELFLTGLFLGIACYLDIAGVILVPLAFGAAFCRREAEVKNRRKAGAVLLCLLGLLAGFCILIGTEALLGGKGYGFVLQAWLERYAPKNVQIPVTLEKAGFPVEYLILAGLLTFGIFGFWRDRESDGLKGWVAALIAAVLLGGFGCSTAELPVTLFLYLLTGILAGVSVGEVFRPVGRKELSADGIVSEETEGMEAGTAGDGKRKKRAGDPGAEAESGRPNRTAERPKAVRMRRGMTSENLKTRTTEEKEAEETALQEKPVEGIQFLENPLPLPRKHVPRRMDYKIQDTASEDDYDLAVDENDDFDY
ncbi:MAG: hypothetical protein NC432_10660 [Roseburia sp.]|nr:hypothetical protein [Roseburia sp.]MCM1099256.1 hypothetical protein [Ruminococcus flavefaciens]